MPPGEQPPERVRVTAIQLVAGALAAMVGTLLASRLGLAGTVIGAAVISVIVTVVTAVNHNSLLRVRERALTARQRSVPRGHAAAADASEEAAADASPDVVDDPGGLVLADERGYHWGVIALASLAVFVLAMVGITVVESVTGRALACSFGRECDEPSTIPLPGRGDREPSPSPTPSRSATPTPTPSDLPSPTPTPTSAGTPSPTPTLTTPTPTPSTTAPPSPATSGLEAGGSEP